MKHLARTVVEVLTWFLLCGLVYFTLSVYLHHKYIPTKVISPSWQEYYCHAYNHLGKVCLTLHNVESRRDWEFDVRVLDDKMCVGTYHICNMSRHTTSYCFDISPIFRKLGSPRELTILCSAPYEYFTIEAK